MRGAGGHPEREAAGAARYARQAAFVGLCDMRDPMTPYYTTPESTGRMLKMMDLANLHGD
jgi:hypothetical protein